MIRTTIKLFLPAVLVAMAFAQPRVEVALYDLSELSPEVRKGMKAEALKIFRQAGVELEWIDCYMEGRRFNHAECKRPLSSTRLMLRLNPGESQKSWRPGFAYIVHGSGGYAVVYPSFARDRARHALWDFADYLGHAVAHELGHLLLGTAEHSRAGLMRAEWWSKELRGLPHNGLIFLPGQLQDVRTLLARRP